jgi:hypothetical protein
MKTVPFAASALVALLAAAPAPAQQGGTWQWSSNDMAPPSFAPPQGSKKRSPAEIGALYAVSVGYGVGLGIWFSAELGIDDPGVFLIPPAILGIAAPVGVYFLDEPAMPRGMPAAIAAGMLIGAGEGIGIASYQFVSADEEDAWGFRGLSRATALGATLGGIGGYALGYYQEPLPESSVLVTSGTMWGAAIGAMFGYGASAEGIGYGLANDSAGLGGLIGYNIGLAGAAVLSTVVVPSWEQIGWMWAGAGIGAAVSLPVFLFYAGEDTPPAKRGFLFMGTAVTLGVVAGGLFGSSDDLEIGRDDSGASDVSISYIAPFAVDGGLGVAVGGQL